MTEVDPRTATFKPPQQGYEEVMATVPPQADEAPQAATVPPLPSEIIDPREAAYERIEELAQNMKAALATRPIQRRVSDDILYGIAVAQAGYEGHYTGFLQEIDKDETPGGKHRLEDKRPIDVPKPEWDKLDAAGMRAALVRQVGKHAVKTDTEPDAEPEVAPDDQGEEQPSGSVYVSQAATEAAADSSSATSAGDSPPEADAATPAEVVAGEPAEGAAGEPDKDAAAVIDADTGEPDEDFVDADDLEPVAKENAVRPTEEFAPAPVPPQEKKRRFGKVAAALAAVPAWLGYKRGKAQAEQKPRSKEAEQARRTRLGVATFLAGSIALGATILLLHAHSPPAEHHPGPTKPPGPVVVTPPPSGGGGGTQPAVGPAKVSLSYPGASIWEGTVDFAHDHGVTLSEGQKQDIVGDILKSNNQTWSSARHLPTGFRFIINQYEVNEILNANK